MHAVNFREFLEFLTRETFKHVNENENETKVEWSDDERSFLYYAQFDLLTYASIPPEKSKI